MNQLFQSQPLYLSSLYLYKLAMIHKVISDQRIRNLCSIGYRKSNVTRILYQFAQNPKFKLVQDPKQQNKLVFKQDGKCRIFQHQNGQREMKWILRVATFATVFNSFLVGMQMTYPMFGAWNMFSFSTCAGLGYLFLGIFQTLSKRTVHKMDLHSNLQIIDITFFNSFWKPQTVTFHLSEFQQPYPSYGGFTKFQLTTLGKVWIKLPKNQFRGVQDYEQTLDCILLGKKITNINVKGSKITK